MFEKKIPARQFATTEVDIFAETSSHDGPNFKDVSETVHVEKTG
jgi:hypothetical protein